MASSTVLRVKRRLEHTPQDALVLMCKRMKTDNKDEELSPSLFVFRGTVKNQETTHVKSIVPKTNVKLQSSVKDVIEKLRKERKEQSSVSRYEVVNCSRGLNLSEAQDQIDLVDLQKANDEAHDVQYAYDLYVSAKQDFDVSMLDKLVSVEHYDTELVLSALGEEESLEENDDEDDSNDEDNWRNDYPDSEHSSFDEEAMIRAIERVDLEDLSSDAGEGDIYDPPGYSDDVTRYGPAYAKYKAKVVAENPDLSDSKGLIQCVKVKELDEESIDGYKDDSDDGFYYGQDEDRKRDHYDESDEFSPD